MNTNIITVLEVSPTAPTFYATRGIPGSGKSFIAGQMLKKNENLMRVNRDDMRFRYFKKEVLPGDHEKAITQLQELEVSLFLGLNYDVIVDDTGLPARFMKNWYAIAKAAGANFKIIHVEVPLAKALAQNEKRRDEGGRYVPPEIIKDRFQRFTPKGKFAKLGSFEDAVSKSQQLIPYVADTSKPRAWIFDMDGTLSLFAGLRGPYEWDKVLKDAPHDHVVNLAKMVMATGDKLIITSARDGSCEDDTRQWLKNNGLEAHAVFMRTAGDMRKDSIVKNELFNANIRDNYNIIGVVDDRLQVCRLWFDLGLPLFRVGDPEIVF